jgi:hypothetical protein
MAQEYCDSSFHVNSASSSGSGGGSVRAQGYSAWSSMASLITKGFVIKRGSPPKFCLSFDGIELGRILLEKTEAFQQTQQQPSDVQPSGKIHSVTISETEHQHKSTVPPTTSPSQFSFSYVSLDGKLTANRESAEISISKSLLFYNQFDDNRRFCKKFQNCISQVIFNTSVLF